jgi:O-succinylbenzoic acid--CoA ligase
MSAVPTMPLLARAALERPEADALVWRGTPLSYAALDAEVRAEASRLAGEGVGRGDRVAVIAAPCPQWVVLFHAIDRCGATLVPVSPRLAADEVADILEDAAPLLVATQVEARDAAGEAFAWTRLPMPDALLDAGATETPPLTILYTSGTTGRPKGVMLARAHHEAAARASRQRLGHDAGDRWLATLPLHHIGGLSMIVRAAQDGAAVVLEPGFDAERAAAALLDREATMASFVATTLARTLDAFPAGARVSGMKAVLVGGGPVPDQLLERAAAAGLPVRATYGLTEACSQVATQACEDAPCTALEGTEIRIADEEILVRGPTVMQGYWRRPEATARALADGWLHTGDLGALDARGGLTVFSRRDDLIVSGGENVYPAEVERALAAHPDVEECAVFAVDDEEWGQAVHAALRLRDPGLFDAEDLRAWCRERLAGFKVPRRLHVVEDFPRTAAGKIRRRDLAGLLASTPRLAPTRRS